MKRILILAIAFVATACFDIHEEVSIAGDRGSVSFTIWMDSSLASAVDIQSLADSVRAADSRVKVSMEKKDQFVGVRMLYPSIPLDSLPAIDSFLHVMKRKDILRIEKVVSVGRDTTGAYVLFSGRYYVFDLKSKNPIVRSNATTIIADTFHRWVIPLDSLMKSGATYRIEAEIER